MLCPVKFVGDNQAAVVLATKIKGKKEMFLEIRDIWMQSLELDCELIFEWQPRETPLMIG